MPWKRPPRLFFAKMDFTALKSKLRQLWAISKGFILCCPFFSLSKNFLISSIFDESVSYYFKLNIQDKIIMIKNIQSKEEKIAYIKQAMLRYLNNSQMEKLDRVLNVALSDEPRVNEDKDEDFLKFYRTAKKVEGCSEKTLDYYRATIQNTILAVDKPIKQITTDDLRLYLDNYQRNGCAGKVTIDNIRRVLSSFFSWLENEDYILKSPVRRIHKVRTGKTVKETYSDESLEIMRDFAGNIRDLALIDLLSSTGIRVGELVKLNRNDIDFENRECIVFGKGDKERKVYFDARTKIHLQRYLSKRKDENPALFVTLLAPFNRLKISGVEIRLRELGRKLNIPRVHPHKFRRTLATVAIDKGMPIEQVQHLLGHQNIDTTMQYAMVNQTNVKNSHRKFIG